LDFAFEFPDTYLKWKLESNSVVCLSAKNEFELLRLYERFKELTPCVIFFEPDVNEYTSLCLYGTEDIRKMLKKLKLIKK